MSQLPQNNEDFDNNPEYAKLYQANNSVQPSADDTDDWEQHASEQPPDVQGAQDGKRVATFSLLFGALGPLTFFLGCWLIFHDLGESGLRVVFVAPLLNILGIWQGWVAQRHGVPALAGRILNWLGLCFFIGIAALFMYIANALSQIN